MNTSVTVVDYGVGNLYSVRRALEVSGCSNVIVSADPRDIANAERLVLPGVGAFADGMRGLRDGGLVEPLIRYAASGRPLLGICLGMQMLATVSDEFGQHEGLGIIPGRVVAIPHRSSSGAALKVPFIGWTPITPGHAKAYAGSCLEGHADKAAVYLVHSFHVLPDDDSHLLASYDFGGNRISAAIRSGSVTGFQFHPEKSGIVGQDILRTFIALP